MTNLAPVIPLRPTSTQEPLLTLSQLMDKAGFSERWWRERIPAMAQAGVAHKWGGCWRFRFSEVERWMEAERG